MTSQNAATPTAEARDDFTSLATGYQFVEAPRVEDDGTLWFSDLTGTGYYRQRPGQPVETVLADRQWIGGAVMTEDGAIICGGRGGMAWIDAATGETTPFFSSSPTVTMAMGVTSEPVPAVVGISTRGRRRPLTWLTP